MKLARIAAIALAACLGGSQAFSQPSPCPLPGQKPMLVAQLFFGRSIAGRGPLTDREWSSFAAKVLTPNFPDGFTAYDAGGQWLNSETRGIVRERSKVVIVAVPSDASVAARIAAVSDAYRAQFRQLSVGVITETACAAF